MSRKGRITECHYVTLVCGNCFWQSPLANDACLFSCTTCGAPTLECEKCRDLAKGYDLPPITICATCSMKDETNRESAS